MILCERMLDRFNNQHKSIKSYIDDLPPEAIYNRIADDKFSIHETIAYLTRYHHVFIERLLRMKNEVNPYFEMYMPDEDGEFKFTVAKTTGSLLHELYRLREEIIQIIQDLPAEASSRVGTHAVLGRMNINQWLEFFLLHESNQLFKIFKMAGSFWSMEVKNNSNVVNLSRSAYRMDELAG